MAALRVGSELLLAGFDASSVVPHARAPHESTDSYRIPIEYSQAAQRVPKGYARPQIDCPVKIFVMGFL